MTRNIRSISGGDTTSYMTDIYPIYSCPKADESLETGTWYGACRDSCTMGSNVTITSLEVYIRNDTIGEVVIKKVSSIWINRQSHVSLFGDCEVNRASDFTRTPTESDLNNIINKALMYPDDNQGTLIIDTVEDPSCDYFNDHMSGGFVHKIVNERWPVKTDIEGNKYLQDPQTHNMVPFSAQKLYSGNKWHIWTNKNGDKQGCYFQMIGGDNCTVSSDTHTYTCTNLGITFSLSIADKVQNTCVGDLNISSDGIIYKVKSTTKLSSFSNRLISLWTQTQEAHITELITLVNDGFKQIESSYCESTCDTVDILLHRGERYSTVVETPVGPWLPFTKEGKGYVVPCKADTDLSLKLPLIICEDNLLLKVQSVRNDEEYWWDPSRTYVSPDTLCPSSLNSETYVHHLMGKEKDLRINFWRGTAIIPYPYNLTVMWEEQTAGKVHRSAKWFPRIKMLAYQMQITLPKLNHELISATSKVHQEYLSSGGKLHERGTLVRIINWVKDIYLSGVGTWNSIEQWVGETVKEGKLVISIIVVCLCTMLFVFFSISILNMYNPGNNMRVRRDQQVLREGHFLLR